MRLRDLISQILFAQSVGRRIDSYHPHWRRYTAAYRRKRAIVKNVWITSGVLMVALGSLEYIVALGLGTTFLSFAILDETE